MGGASQTSPCDPCLARAEAERAATLGSDGEPPLTVLGLYWQPSFWSLGPHRGASSFFLAPFSFARLGHRIHVSAPRAKGQPALENDEGILIHRYRGAIRFDSNPRRILPLRLISRVLRYLYYLVIGTWNGVRVAREVHPDIVIGYHYHSAAAACIVARLLRLPNITRLFGTQLNLILRSRLRRWGGFMQVIALRAPASYIIMHDDGSEGDRIARRLGVPPERLRFWRDGFDPAMYRPAEDRSPLRARLGIPADSVILFCVGRMTDDKHMERLVEIMPVLRSPEPRVALMLVGDGVDRPMIERRIDALDVRHHVFLTGSVAREEIAPLVNLGDIFVGVSDRTNINLPAIEAMSCAKPVVALDVGGTRDLVRDGETGLLVSAERWREELPAALISLVRDPARRERMGQAARALICREVPTITERERMEVALAVQAVREFRERRDRAR